MNEPAVAPAQEDHVPVAPGWAMGCDQCTCGIVSAPKFTGYLSRIAQYQQAEIVFCECLAGQWYLKWCQKQDGGKF